MGDLNKRIAYYRKLNNMTQSELAKKTGVSATAVSKWEQGSSCPDISLLPKLADLFSISIDELFGKETIREPIYDYVDTLPWNDDGVFRIAVFYGKKMMQQSSYKLQKGSNEFDFCFDINSRINGVCKVTI